jgi:hypothetical protein
VATSLLEGDFGWSAVGDNICDLCFFLYRRVEYLYHNPFRYSFDFCHACTLGLHTQLHNIPELPGYLLQEVPITKHRQCPLSDSLP